MQHGSVMNAKILVTTVCCICLAIAQAVMADDLTSLIQQRYEKLRSFSAEFEQTLTHRESGSVQSRKGRLLFQKPLKIHWQTRKPHAEILVVTPKEIWDYLPDEELAYRYHPDLIKNSGQIIRVVTGQAALTKDFDLKMLKMENQLQKIKLYPKEPSTQLVEAVIWVEPATGYIRRALAIDFYGNSNKIVFNSFTTDPNIQDSDFHFR